MIPLLFAAAISAALWMVERGTALPNEAITIFVVVMINAVVGFIQSAGSESSVAALTKMAAARAHVIRDGVRQSIYSTEILSGDIILVEERDTVAADPRLIQNTAL